MFTMIQLKRNLQDWLNCQSLKYASFVTKRVVAYNTNQSFIATFSLHGEISHISHYPSNYLIDESVFSINQCLLSDTYIWSSYNMKIMRSRNRSPRRKTRQTGTLLCVLMNSLQTYLSSAYSTHLFPSGDICNFLYLPIEFPYSHLSQSLLDPQTWHCVVHTTGLTQDLLK